MIIYLYDEETKHYLGQSEIENEGSMPINATSVAPPDGTFDAVWNGSTWENVQLSPLLQQSKSQQEFNASILLQIATIVADSSQNSGNDEVK